MGTLEAAPERPLPALAERIRAYDRTPWIEAVKIVLVTRVVFYVLAYVGAWLFSTGSTGPPTEGFLQMWTRWDAIHFTSIAEFGYRGPNSGTYSTAFFPLFPLLERAGSAFGLSTAAAGMVVSAVSGVVACAYLYRLAEEDIGEGAGRRAALYLNLFPTAVFLMAPYSEGLFLAGAIPAFYYARRSRWLAAGIPAAVAVGARVAGIFLLAGLVVEFIRKRDFSMDNMLNAMTAVLLGGLPILAYGVFLARATGNPFHFLESQRVGWGRAFVGPVASFTNTWNTWNSSYFTNWMFAWRLEIVAAIIGLAIILWALLKREWGYAAYMGLGLGALITSSWYYSIPRMLLTWFPFALFLAALTARDHRRHELALLALAPLAALGVLLYTRNIWFF
jgi:Gpi18-like mannosyltransferase